MNAINVPIKIAPPLQMTIRQHIFTRAGLKRFADLDRLLQVLDVQTGGIRRLGPNADCFVVRRGWDQRTESAIMGPIERQFGILAKRILSGELATLDCAENCVASTMYSLWRIRHHRAQNPIPDHKIGNRPERPVLDTGMDQGEHYGIISITSDGMIPGYMLAGPLLQSALDRQAEAMAGKRWGIVRAGEGEFAMPDSFGEFMVIPLSPACCLIADEANGTAARDGVAQLNGLARISATKYLAARDFSACPGL